MEILCLICHTEHYDHFNSFTRNHKNEERLVISSSFVLSTQVSAVPTVLAMKNGDVVDKFVGIKDEDQLEAFLKKLIG